MRTNHWKVLYFSTVFLFLSACGGGGSGSIAPGQPPTPQPPSEPESNPPFEWELASADALGIDSDQVQNAVSYAMQDGLYSQGILVVKDGKIVGEEYRGIGENETRELKNYPGSRVLDESIESFANRDQTSLATSWSMAKSITSLLFGIAQGMDYFPDGLDESASTYLTEWQNDVRESISIREILDMRSGLEPACYFNGWYVCDAAGASAGGYFGAAEDQLTGCIYRNLAQTSVPHPWYYSYGLVFERGHFMYSNCDTMILGEIFFRATGKDIMTFAETYLFSELGIRAYWWRDSAEGGQADGNYLAYCCIDATTRDFAKIGLLIMNDGQWQGKEIVPKSYIEQIKNITTNSVVSELGGSFSYGFQFWTLMPRDNCGAQQCFPTNTLYAAIGYDGQFIVMDFRNNLMVVRNSLYTARLNYSDDRKYYMNPSDEIASNYTLTAPSFVSETNVGDPFIISDFMSRLLGTEEPTADQVPEAAPSTDTDGTATD